MKPILTISDFARGIVDDQTAAVRDGFAEMYGVDIKSFPGVLQAQYQMSNPYLSVANVCSVAKFRFDQHADDLAMKAFGVAANASDSNVYSNVGDGSGWSVFRSLASSLNVAYPETFVYQNRLMYPNGRGAMGSALCYAEGTVSVTNGSTAVSLSGGTWTADMGDGYGAVVSSKIYVDNGSGTFSQYAFSYGTATSGTLGGSYTGATGSGRKYYIVAFNDTGIGLGPVALSLTNQTGRYRPMAEKDNQLYVADGGSVLRYNPSLATFSKSLDLGTDYAVKKMVRNGEWLYLLADKNPDALQGIGGAKSVLFIWDGSSQSVNRAIPYDCACFSILAADNVIWCLTEARSQLGAGDLALRYFNGSDFPVAKHIALNRYRENPAFGNAYPNALAATNGSLLIGVRNGNAYARCGVYEYSNYDNEGKALVFRQYANEPTCVWVLPGANGKDRPVVEGATGESTSKVGTEDRLFSDVNGQKPYVTTNWYFITDDQFPNKVKAVTIDTFEPLTSGCSVKVEIARDGGSLFSTYADITAANQDLPCYFDPLLCQSVKFRLTLTTDGINTPRVKNIRLY